MITAAIIIALLITASFLMGRQYAAHHGAEDGERRVLKDLEQLLEILERPHLTREKNPEGWDRMIQRMYQFAREYRHK